MVSLYIRLLYRYGYSVFYPIFLGFEPRRGRGMKESVQAHERAIRATSSLLSHTTHRMSDI